MRNFEIICNNYIEQYIPSRIKDAMIYSLLAGGKRLRPKLLLACLSAYGKDETIGYPFACALEMVHTYSLIHDDLPAMDNDVLRRGRKTCHIEFDEATAILAGDGLLTAAFDVVANAEAPANQVVECTKVLAFCAGVNGMIYGQCLDMAAETKTITWDELELLHANKTGKLFVAPLMMAAVLSDDKEHLDTWKIIGEKLGLAFQIQDDILDVTKSPLELGKSNSDVENHKSTSVTLLGIEEAKKRCENLFMETKKMINSLQIDSTELIKLIESIQIREM